MKKATKAIEFTKEEMSSIIYSAREAQIRFKRLRKCVRRGDEDVSHWGEDECDEKIKFYKRLEGKLTKKYMDAFLENWY